MQDKGFFGALFDMSFSEFVTIKLIRILYILQLIIIGIGLVVGLIGSLVTMFSRGGFVTGLLGFILAPLMALFWIILARVSMELIIVVFRIAENTTDLVQMKKGE